MSPTYSSNKKYQATLPTPFFIRLLPTTSTCSSCPSSSHCPYIRVRSTAARRRRPKPAPGADDVIELVCHVVEESSSNAAASDEVADDNNDDGDGADNNYYWFPASIENHVIYVGLRDDANVRVRFNFKYFSVSQSDLPRCYRLHCGTINTTTLPPPLTSLIACRHSHHLTSS